MTGKPIWKNIYLPFWDRFWARVKVGEQDECWPWIATMAKGVGVVAFGHGKERRRVQAPRIAWELWNNKSMPRDHFACHHCDNGACCNPLHIFSGTPSDNQQDSIRKNRNSYGERHPNSKLRSVDVTQIRTRFAAGESMAALARVYGVRFMAVSSIVKRRKWKQQ